MSNLDLLTVRLKEPSDDAFIYQTWLNGLRYGNPFYRKIEKSIYDKEYTKVISALIQYKPTVLIACLKDQPDVIIGYSVINADRLHWIFIKKDWRGLGISKMLVNRDEIKSFSHLTILGQTIWKEKLKHLIFNPFL